MTDTLRKRAERQRRREAGEVRVEVWLSPGGHADLKWLCAQVGEAQAYVIESALWALRHKEGKQ